MHTRQSTDAFSGLENDEALNSAQIDQRARALRDQLTLDKKISLMHGQQPFWLGLAAKSHLQAVTAAACGSQAK
jgi:hypothetical protein